MKSRVRDLVQQGDRLFSKRANLHSLWQELGLNFNPMRADFTAQYFLGEEFAAHLMTSRPLLAQRDLGNALSGMLRPRGTAWFRARTEDENVNQDAAAKQWLDAKSDVMRRVMYHNHSQFVRATKQGDSDFVLFGQCVITPEPNKYRDGILYRNWHLRDVAWCENPELIIDLVHRQWAIEARGYMGLFPKTAADAVRRTLDKDPYREIKCRHIVIPADDYDLASYTGKKVNRQRFPFVSIYVDIENEVILEEVPRRRLGYVIPRWLTVSGSQYAHSPAAVAALPEARLLQRITLTLLEAGEKAVDPPMVASKEAIAGGVNLLAGGVTWIDEEYDEEVGKALKQAMDTPDGLNWGVDREERIAGLIAEAFYLNKITLPDLNQRDMTAFETQKRIEEYIRGALPLFEPMEVEYNGALCEETFNLCIDMNIFGPLDDMPPILGNREIRWQFESPLQAATERAKSQAFLESMNLLKIAFEADPGVRHDIDIRTSFREAVSGSGAPAKWIVPTEQADKARAAEQQQMAMQQAAAAIAQAGQVAQDVGAGAQALDAAGLIQAAR